MKHTISYSALLAIAATALASCNTPDSVAPVDHSALHISAAASQKSDKAIEAAGLATAVKSQTARFHAVKQAEKAGYVQTSECVAIPVGGMGFHYAKFSLVDPVFDPMNPEALVYAPDENGKLHLVAVEYIVINTGTNTRPSFGSQLFDINGVPGLPAHWSLHAWVHKDNPLGMFMPFNPDVSCDGAEEE
jgi:hypothetical protein